MDHIVAFVKINNRTHINFLMLIKYLNSIKKFFHQNYYYFTGIFHGSGKTLESKSIGERNCNFVSVTLLNYYFDFVLYYETGKKLFIN